MTNLFLGNCGIENPAQAAICAIVAATEQQLLTIARKVFDQTVTVKLLDTAELVSESLLEKYLRADHILKTGPWNCRKLIESNSQLIEPSPFVPSPFKPTSINIYIYSYQNLYHNPSNLHLEKTSEKYHTMSRNIMSCIDAIANHNRYA